MRWRRLITLTVIVSGCNGEQSGAVQIAQAQAKSRLGPTGEWKLDPALPLADIQKMRDRAYSYCLAEKRSGEECFREQDYSLFAFANTYQLVRFFREKREPEFPFAAAHYDYPAAFKRVHDYCHSLYKDHGSRDARLLGPCMSAGVGGDFHSIVGVP